jgi:2-keto-4-pentenoate hydratase/2-oxohepta-3-ene-1,7-dioic acid hydratase in catechol pathway
MIVLHVQTPNGPKLAVRTRDGIFDVNGDLQDLFAGRQPKLGNRLSEDELQLAPCVPHPGKIVCVGLNYRRHAAEANMAPPKRPILFSKFENTLAASGQEIQLPPVSNQFDYEAELVVVIGRTARAVTESDALDHVWGYCNGNDLSARDLQMESSQWLLGKSLDGFAPIGPWIVSRDEAGPLADMAIRCTVNGEVRQSSSVGDLIFGVPKLVSFISHHLTLRPGDIIFTGTPEGVAMGRPDKPWLKPGDEVVVEVGPLGRLVSRMVAPEIHLPSASRDNF